MKQLLDSHFAAGSTPVCVCFTSPPSLHIDSLQLTEKRAAALGLFRAVEVPRGAGGTACISDLETRAPARERTSAFRDCCGNEEHREWSGLILCAHS